MPADSRRASTIDRPPSSRLPEALILSAAVECAEAGGILGLLALPRTIDDLVEDGGFDRRVLVALIDALVATEIVESFGDGRFVIPASTGDYLRANLAMLGTMRTALTTGVRAPAPVGGRVGADPASAIVVPYLGRRWAASTETLVASLDPPRGARILGAGAGAAGWSIAFAAADPDACVVVVDVAPVLVAAAAAAADAGVAHQFRFVDQDLHELALDTRFDIVLTASTLHLFSSAVAGALVLRLARHLAAGGALVVVDAFVPAGEVPPPPLALYALSLTLRTDAGGLVSFAACASWMRSAGLHGIRQIALPTPQLTAMVASSPDR